MNINLDLETYITAHTSDEDAVLYELNRETHLHFLQSRMLSGHVQGKILKMICHMIRPQRVLELGTFTGYSAISMGLALQPGAKLHTIEAFDELEEVIVTYIEKAGLTDVVVPHFGQALELIPSLDETFDLVFIDADKREYTAYYHAVFDKIRPGGYILADNILWDGKVVDPTQNNDPQTKGILEFNQTVQNDPRVENVILPIRDGMMLVRKK